ncbi:MAG: serine/threonine-protein kinase [Planctomycetota bacterium]
MMTALLDKLRRGGRNAASDRAFGGSASADPESDNESEAVPLSDLPLSDSGLRLDDTMAVNGAPKPMTFTYAPGSMPLPRYTIRRGIGMGGFGEVYFAVSEAGKEVALKRVQRNLDVELRGVSHCLNLKHPNLVSLFDICRDPGDQAWVVMEYVAGPNLRQVLDDAPEGLSEADARRWFAGIAAGVSHLHSAGLVHRDLKPGNIFDDMGIVKVGDYGLSKFISASHRGGHTESVGTFHYMAPEIGRGDYGREIDVYALGVMLYELLTGRVPFDGESCHEIIVKHLTASPDLSMVDSPYREAISAALQKDPAKRPGTVSDLASMINLEIVSGQAAAQAVPVSQSVAKPALAGENADKAPRDAFASPVLASATFPGSPRSSKPEQQATHPGLHPGFAPEPATPHSATQDEPFARAIKHSIADLHRWWKTLDRSPGAKIFLALAAGFVLLVNTHWLLPLLSFVAVFYVPYYVIRHMVLHVKQQPTYAEAQRIATSHGPPRQTLTKSQQRYQLRSQLRAKRSIHRVGELMSSWTAAFLTVAVLMMVTSVIGLRSGPVDATSLAPYGWMAMTVALAASLLLGMGKIWEREEGEGLTRRIALAGVGAGVGVAAYALHQFLMMPMDEISRGIDATDLPQALYMDGSIPRASAYMAHFAMLFAALRWWKPVDPLRRVRLSVWSVAVAVVGEWLLHQVMPIPQPEGLMIAGGIAIAIQMSAPWINLKSGPTRMQANGPMTGKVA